MARMGGIRSGNHPRNPCHPWSMPGSFLCLCFSRHFQIPFKRIHLHPYLSAIRDCARIALWTLDVGRWTFGPPQARCE